MRTVTIEGLDTKELTLTGTEGPEASFAFPAVGDQAPRIVKARSDGTVIRFFPERCAGHRDVLRALEIAV